MTESLKLVVATHNPHKLEELRAILGDRLVGIDLVGYDGPAPEEDGPTFQANALIKARAAHVHTGLPAIADDSGLTVAALSGEPGLRSARYAGTGDDADNRALVLEKLADEPERAAHFTCVAAFVGDGVEHTEVGIWPGEILPEPVGDGGFGYDPIFRPINYDISAAQLGSELKNSLSHRAIAFRKLAAFITRN